MNGTHFVTNFEKTYGNGTINYGKREIIFSRNVLNKHQIIKWNHKRFTGFKVQWNCTNCFGQVKKPYYNENKFFVRLANIIYKDTESKEIWKAIKSTKREHYLTIHYVYRNNWEKKQHFYDYGKSKLNMYEIFFITMEGKLNFSTKYPDTLVHDDITDQALEDAVNMFYYITAPEQDYWIYSLKIYTSWLEKLSPKRLLGI